MAGPERPRRVGYVLGRFPAISQTFVLNEILGLEQAGVEVEVFALKPALDPKFHSALGELRGSVRFVPRVDELKLVLEHNASAARRFRREYARALLYVIARPHNRLFWRFLQGGYIAELAARYELDHLHAHFATHATTVASLASMITRIPYSFTAHAFDIYKSNVRKDFLRDHIDRSDFVVTVSDANRQYLNEIGNGAGPKVFVVRNGIDLQSFSPADASPGEPFTIVAVARLVEKKGLNVLLDACRLLDDRARSFRCLILGCGPLRDQLQARIGQLDLAEQVRLLGSGTQGDVLAQLRRADVFALPCIVNADGNRDALPVAIVEALACGVPVVSTPVGGIPEAVRHSQNGLLVPQRDPAALADAFESLMTDASLYERLRANARPSVVETYDMRETASRLRDLFVGRRP